MMQKLYQRGFTLIELLVVIAIIGILASVVLASLNSARDKGTDAANKSNLNNIRAQAELVYDDDGDYANVCSDANVSAAITAAGADCDATADAWAAEVLLVSPATTTYYCVDSTGSASEGASKGESATVCP
ncbi:MAG: type II secretion system protein [Candidatus Paceibacterota bacterium]